ncbi:MAG: ATP-binding protein [Rubrivivax sp.]|nr:ATP-binding protein [Rubrivivax sp.]
MAEAIRVAIVGAESTGKTTLAAALAPRLARDTGLRVTWVPEVLRDWCHHLGRTPKAHEQAALVRAQHERIEESAARHDVVICDTTALMTAVYSRLVFTDRSLDERAVALHRRMSITLLTALDLPWVADGIQRDGPHVREPVDRLLREFLIGQRLPWALVAGAGQARVEAAVDALAPLLRPASGQGGLFTRLAGRNAEPAARRWRCENCDDPSCEHRLLGSRR